MKKNLLLIAVCLTYVAAYVFNGCRKEKIDDQSAPVNPGISTSFTEEFDSIYQAIQKRGWITNSSASALALTWIQGAETGFDKIGGQYGFPAYSYTKTADEYAAVFNFGSSGLVSSWLITPVLYVKNGDKISFYTRCDNNMNYADRLQVRLNLKASTNIGNSIDAIGDFKNVVVEVNPSQANTAYPVTWTKYEYTFSGISKQTNVRIGFRYFAPDGTVTKGIGIDQFKFQVQ